jgi:hypothetical protein
MVRKFGPIGKSYDSDEEWMVLFAYPLWVPFAIVWLTVGKPTFHLVEKAMAIGEAHRMPEKGDDK